MPNIITHTLFSDEVLEGLSKADQDLIEPRMGLYHIGANGPDYLFFAGLNLKDFWKKNPLRKYGGQLHSGHVNEFYAAALNAIWNQKDTGIARDMEAYVCGHLCHWALDSTAHPYIFYKTGRGEAESSYRHHAMESLLDAIMLKVKRNESTATYFFPDIAEARLPDARAIARVYVPALKETLGVDVKPHEIKHALDDWFFMQHVFYDAAGGKRNAARTLEKMLGKENAVSGLLIPTEPEDNWDVCNLKHEEWHHPCDASIVSTESFLDLFDKAIVRARTAIELFLAAVADENAAGTFLQFVDDKTYDTGLNEKLPMTEFDIIDFQF